MLKRFKQLALTFDQSIKGLAKILVGLIAASAGKFLSPFGVILVPLGLLAIVAGCLQFTGIWPRPTSNSRQSPADS